MPTQSVTRSPRTMETHTSVKMQISAAVPMGKLKLLPTEPRLQMQLHGRCKEPPTLPLPPQRALKSTPLTATHVCHGPPITHGWTSNGPAPLVMVQDPQTCSTDALITTTAA